MQLRLIAGLGLALAAVSTTSASAATVTIAPVGEVSAMSAWNGHAVFSERDPVTKLWRLEDATSAGVRPLGVAPQAQPVVADVGPDAQGAPAAVFTLCHGPQASLTCRIYQLALGGEGARPQSVRSLVRPGYTEAAPTIWRGRIAFGRTLNGVRGTRIAAIYLQRRPGSHRLVRLARGTVPLPCRKPCYRSAQPTQMDLGPTGLAFTWTMTGGNTIPQDAQELRRVPLDGRLGTLLDAAVAAECGFGNPISFVAFDSPSLDGRRVDYLRVAGDCWDTESQFVRTGPTPMAQSRHVVGGVELAYAMARDGKQFWSVRGAPYTPASQGDVVPCTDGSCHLVLSSDVPFQPFTVPRRPRPPVFFPAP